MKTPILMFVAILAIPSLASAIPNPAAQFCVQCGYRSEIRTDPQGGQYGVCAFPDGSECDEWDYFRKCNAPQTCGDCNCPWPCPKRIIYVDDDANGLNDGSSWLNAYKFLQDALMMARDGDELCVAQGIYKPDDFALSDRPNLGRAESFQLKNGVAIRGAYAGLGNMDPNSRNIDLYKTILSGDLNGDDDIDFINNGENSYHIVIGEGIDETAVIDGLVITAGNANGQWQDYNGGGIHNSGNPTIANCTFYKNFARNEGGGMYNSGSNNLKLTNCIFIGNSSNNHGGGMYNSGSNNLKLTNCIFIGNSAGYNHGGGIYNFKSSTIFTNCTLTSNWGGVGCSLDDTIITNSIVWNNINNDISIFYPPPPPCPPRFPCPPYPPTKVMVSYSCVGSISKEEGAILNWGNGNIDAEPCFADPNNGDYHLKSQAGRWDANEGRWTEDEETSLCIDAGDPASPIGYEPFPNGGRINMGAYGGTSEASKSYFGQPPCETIVAGDINGDCKVDLWDLAIMTSHWLEEH